jgi:hypothetical protein
MVPAHCCYLSPAFERRSKNQMAVRTRAAICRLSLDLFSFAERHGVPQSDPARNPGIHFLLNPANGTGVGADDDGDPC